MIWGTASWCAWTVGESSNSRVGIGLATVGDGLFKKVTSELRITDGKKQTTQNSGKNTMSTRASGAKFLGIPGEGW